MVPCRLYFDGSVCSNGQGVGIVYISPHGAVFEASCRLEYFCTNYQAEYEALSFVLKMLLAIGATHIEAFGDSLLVVQQVSGVFKCFDESLNVYLDECLDVISTLDYFSIAHISRYDNWRANELAQQASGYHVDHSMVHISQEPMSNLANTEEADLKLTTSATNDKSSANSQSQLGSEDCRVAVDSKTAE